MNLAGLVDLVVYLIVAGCILGLLLFLVNISPVPEPYKGWLRFVVLAITILIIIYMLISLIGGAPPRLRGGLFHSLPRGEAAIGILT